MKNEVLGRRSLSDQIFVSVPQQRERTETVTPTYDVRDHVCVQQS